MIKGINFDNQLVTAKDHGKLFRALYNDGVLSGISLSYSGTTLTIGGGYIIAAGREIRLTAEETVSITGTTGYARVLVQIDLAQEATETAFSQASLVTQYAASTSEFAALTQEDVNISGTVYQAVLCVLSLGTAGITGIVSKLGACTIGTDKLADKSVTPAKLSGVTYSSIGLTTDQVRKITYGTADPSGGSNGDIYLQYS